LRGLDDRGSIEIGAARATARIPVRKQDRRADPLSCGCTDAGVQMKAAKPQAASVGDGTPDIRWTSNAPRELISLHGRIGQGRDVLGRLLQDPRMNRAWVEIDKRIDKRAKAPGGVPSREAYQRLWGAIFYAWSKANQAEQRRKAGAILPHRERRDQCLEVADIASRLAKHLEDGPLDLCAHELFPEAVVRLARAGNFQSRGYDVAQQALEWTTFHDLLLELERRAQAEAARPPVVAKVTGEFESNYFIRPLAQHFEHYFGGTMDASLAAITTVVRDRKASKELTANDVKRALRHQGGEKGTK
jgi:hypothetical protein